VHVPQDELGVQAWRQLFGAMTDAPATGIRWLKGRLEVRESTGRAAD
jgi:hypothetical protein